MMRFRWLIVAGLLLATPSFVRADEQSHRKAAEDLLLTMGVDKQLQSSIDQMLDIQTKQNPAMARFKPTMMKFFNKYLSWEGLKPDFIQIYCDAFTEQELKEIYAFYQTPTGKKMVSKMPELTSKGMTLGASKVQANQAELQRMIQQAATGGTDQ